MVTLQCQMVEHTERRPTLGVILATQYKETNIYLVLLDHPGHLNLFVSEVYKAISILIQPVESLFHNGVDDLWFLAKCL